MSTSPFSRFTGNKLSGAKKKEFFKQEKRKARKETKEYFKSLKESQLSGKIAPAKTKKTVTPAYAQPPKGKALAGAKKGGKIAPVAESEMPLNKYISHCGVCSRRDAATLVQEGKITVNGTVMTTPGYKVKPDDVVKMGKQTLALQVIPVHILLNKPKDCLTTMDDPHGRDTVLRYIKNATSERVYPVGRLDRNTTGVLLLTNDGELAQKLTHPSFEVKKIYEVKLDKPLEKGHYEKITNGLTLEDGFIAPDALAFPDIKDKSVVGIEIHSGRNRIVRRIFESLGYQIKALDRVSFANLTKKNVERGKWRFLHEREVRNLKFLNASAGKKKKINQARHENS
jgi:23S rRNA pseudouridine2605 synthase